MSKGPTVYVVQEDRKKNIIAAMDFGSLEPILDADDQIVLSGKAAMARIKFALQSFSDDDYLLCIGDPAAIGMACAEAARVNNGRYKLLKWDRQEKRYYVVQVDHN